jgi:hypothetical protein
MPVLGGGALTGLVIGVARRPVPSADTLREPVQVASNEERPLPDARRNITGRPEGEQKCPEARAIYGRRNRTPAVDLGFDTDRAAAVAFLNFGL